VFGGARVPSVLDSSRPFDDGWSPELARVFAGIDAFCSASRCAFSMISCCFVLSFARIGTKSFGTGVCSLKFDENFFRSLSLIALSCTARLLRSSATLFFSVLAKFLKAARASSVSTLEVAFDIGALGVSARREVFVAAALTVEPSLLLSCLASVVVALLDPARAVPFSVGFEAALVSV